MKKARKLAALLLALVMGLAIAGCGQKTSNPGQTGSGSGQQGGGSGTPAGDGGWPNGAITLIVPYSAGSSSDTCARPLATALSKILGVPVVVEDLPGGGGWIGWRELLNRELDGNTFALTNSATVLAHYDESNPREETIEDFEYLINAIADNCLIAIRGDETRFTDFESLIEYSKSNDLMIAAMSGGMTSNDEVTAQALKKQYGVNFTMVPVDAGSDAMAMFVSGNTDIFFGNVGDVMSQLDNNVKPIVILAEEHDQLLPDVPISSELGFDLHTASYRGYSYAKGVDAAIVEKMTQALQQAVEDPEYVSAMDTMGMVTRVIVGQAYRDTLADMIDSRLELFDLAK